MYVCMYVCMYVGMYLCMHMDDLSGVNQATAHCLLGILDVVDFCVCADKSECELRGDKCATKGTSRRLGCTYAKATGRVMVMP